MHTEIAEGKAVITENTEKKPGFLCGLCEPTLCPPCEPLFCNGVRSPSNLFGSISVDVNLLPLILNVHQSRRRIEIGQMSLYVHAVVERVI